MALPENTQYKKPDATISAAVKAAYKVGGALSQRAPKSVDVSRFQGVADKVSGLQEGQQTGLGTITTPYGGGTRYEKRHEALDIANKMGTPIKSFYPGTVTEVRTGQKQGDQGFGNFVKIKDNQGRTWRYSHLKGDWTPVVGAQISRGQVIGAMGNTGSTYSQFGGDAAHLDIRIRDIYNRAINPSGFIK